MSLSLSLSAEQLAQTEVSVATKDDVCSMLDLLINKMLSEGTEEEWVELLSHNKFALVLAIAKLYGKARITEETISFTSSINDKLVRVLFMIASIQPHINCKLLTPSACKVNVVEQLISTLISDLNVRDFSNSSHEECQADCVEKLIPRFMLLHAILLYCSPSDLNHSCAFLKTLVVQLLPLLSYPVIDVVQWVVRVVILIDYLHPKENLLLSEVSKSDISRIVSEQIITLVNKPYQDDESAQEEAAGGKLLVALLSFCDRVFQDPNQTFFYTNDVFVLVDILLRRINDGQRGNETSVAVMQTLDAVIRWPDYTRHLYRAKQIQETMQSILDGYSSKGSLESATLRASLSQSAIHMLALVDKINRDLCTVLRIPPPTNGTSTTAPAKPSVAAPSTQEAVLVHAPVAAPAPLPVTAVSGALPLPPPVVPASSPPLPPPKPQVPATALPSTSATPVLQDPQRRASANLTFRPPVAPRSTTTAPISAVSPTAAALPAVTAVPSGGVFSYPPSTESKQAPPRPAMKPNPQDFRALPPVGAAGGAPSSGHSSQDSHSSSDTRPRTTSAVVSSSPVAVALYDYAGGVRKDRELLFKAGERVYVLQRAEGWWYGLKVTNPSLDGWFPASYVHLV